MVGKDTRVKVTTPLHGKEMTNTSQNCIASMDVKHALKSEWLCSTKSMFDEHVEILDVSFDGCR